MNILFYLDHSVASGFGGIEHATKQVAAAMSSESCRCFYAYRVSGSNDCIACSNSSFCGNIFVPNLSHDRQCVLQKLQEWEIDAVIVQSVFDDSILIWRSLIVELNRPCKLLFAYHYNPGSEFDYLQGLRFGIKTLIAKIRWRRYVKRTYNIIWKTADKIIVLSKKHVPTWKKMSSADSSDKFVVIPNMNSFDHTLEIEDLNKKEKIVLIVSRLSEHEKKISKLLKVWKHIEKDSRFNDWNLVIVGDGPDRTAYEMYAKENLTRFEFTGKQPSQNYFRKAPIFVMSSAQEGWGLVITEAQQMGCVPVVLNTFASASDIIQDVQNGFLVGGMNEFRKKLKILMIDTNMRYQMAEKSIKESDRFSQKTIGKQWTDLLNM